MKIFGWICKLPRGTTEYHRVAHRNSPGVLSGEVSGGKSSTLLAAREKQRDTEALLLPSHVLLTIGTLGHSDPHLQQQMQEEPLTDHEEKELKQTEQDTAVAKPNATVVVAFHPSESQFSKTESAVEQSVNNMKQEVIMVEEEIITREPLLKEDKEKIEKRTTLADLFAAEPASAGGESPNGTTADKRQASCPTKNIPKKTMKGEESPHSSAATKKIHRLITRMLKKRIHPDLARGEERHRRREASVGGAGGNNGDLLSCPRIEQ